MVTGIVIAHETHLTLQKVEFQNLTDYQTAVGGYIKMIRMNGHPLVIVADEDGKVKCLPINRRATCLRWLLDPTGLGEDFLVGDVDILGAKRSGVMNDVPATLLTLLLETPRNQVQVCLSHEHSSWVTFSSSYDDFFEARMHAIDLMGV